MKPLLKHETLLDVAFHHLDPMEVVWHGNYFRFFERARCAMLQTINYDYPEMRASGYAWPVIDCHCRFSKPITYGMKVKVLSEIVECENRLKINYTLTNAEDGTKLATGYTIQAAVDMRNGELCFVLPDVMLEKLPTPPGTDAG